MSLHRAGPKPHPPLALLMAMVLSMLALPGCTPTVEWIGIQLLYREAPDSKIRVLRDLDYGPQEDGHPEKHRLDLYLPQEGGRGAMIYVHGGGWTAGDKSLTVSGADVYGNVGRFYASRGFATAVINYRLQPEITWREQVADVARATAWVYRNLGDYGASAAPLFLSGHSAGAQLATWVALDESRLASHGLAPDILCGLVSLSGAGFDIRDRETYEKGAKIEYYEERFRTEADGEGDGWMAEASPILHLSSKAPAFLLLHTRREWESLKHQNRLFFRALQEQGVSSELRPVGGHTHGSIALAFSHEGSPVSRSILEFLSSTSCSSPAETQNASPARR